VASEAGWAPPEGAGHWEQPSFLVAEGRLLWASDVLHQLDLGTSALTMKGLTRPILLVAVNSGEAWGIEDGHAQTLGGDLFAVNLRTGAERTVMPGGVSQRDCLYQFDGDDLYFIRDGEKQSSFMRLRADSGQTEFLGHEPQGPWAALASKAASLKDQTIVVRDRLVVGPFVSNPGSAPKGPPSRTLALGEGKERLPFLFGQPKMGCTGDDSRLCCRTQAFGQLVVATGKLGGSKVQGWDLRSAEICEVPAELSAL
jgi:hypothetical protein